MFFSFFDKIPLIGAKIFIALCLVAIMVGVWTLPKKYIFKGLEKPKMWQNLKLWVTALIIVQIVIYLAF